MGSFRQVRIFVNIETGKEIDQSTLSDREGLSCNLVYGELIIFNFLFRTIRYNEDGSKYLDVWPVPEGASFSVFGDVDFIDRTSFMFQATTDPAGDDPINKPGDFLYGQTAKAELGEMSARVNTTTDRFKDVLNEGRVRGNCTLCVTMTPPSQVTPVVAKSVLMLVNFVAENRPVQPLDGPPVENPMPRYYTAEEVSSLLRSAYRFRFSTDGLTDWHSVQSAVDRYYQQSILDGAWSDTMELLSGVAGAILRRKQFTSGGQPTYTIALDSVVRIYDLAVTGPCTLMFDWKNIETALPVAEFAATWELHVALQDTAALGAFQLDPQIIWLGPKPTFASVNVCYNLVIRRERRTNSITNSGWGTTIRTYVSSAYEVLQ